MMLPEHVKLLREWQEEDRLVAKPLLDEAQLEQMNANLQRAYTQRCPIDLKIWEKTAIYRVSGIIQKMNTVEQSVELENGKKIPFSAICDAVIDE